MIREIVVLSGKGGTGKTVLAASLVLLAAPAVAADADVESANLGLLLPGDPSSEETCNGHLRPVRDPGLCAACGECRDRCRFGAIGPDLEIDESACEGCALCARICPAGALTMVPRPAGEILVSMGPGGVLVEARLRPGEESSGMLVARVREVARERALALGIPLLITDGPPGVACPAISALSGADLAVVVTEPSLGGRHDLHRLLDLAGSMSVPAALVVNRHDLAPDLTARIEGECAARGVPALGRIPFDPEVVRAVVRGVSPVAGEDGPAARAIRRIAQEVIAPEEGRVRA
jgi:MinD superfamily P-loop ATPase